MAYNILNAADYSLRDLLTAPPPASSVLDTANDLRWAGRVARGIVAGDTPRQGRNGAIRQVLVVGDDGLVLHYDADRSGGSFYPNGKPRNIARRLCGHYPNCVNPRGPWMKPYLPFAGQTPGDSETQVCRACRLRHPTQRQRERCAELNRQRASVAGSVK